MKNVSSAVALSALTVWAITVAQAAPEPSDHSAQARVMLERVESLSASIESTADKLAVKAKELDQADAQRAGLDSIRDDVNIIGRYLRILEADEDSLPEWECRTVDEILPLMQQIAMNTKQAIQNYASNRNHMWTTAFPEESARLYTDAARVKELLDGRLKLAAVREQEQHIQAKLGGD